MFNIQYHTILKGLSLKHLLKTLNWLNGKIIIYQFIVEVFFEACNIHARKINKKYFIIYRQPLNLL